MKIKMFGKLHFLFLCCFILELLVLCPAR